MATSLRYENGTLQSLVSATDLASLAAGSGVVGTTAYDNSAAGNQYFWGDFVLTLTFATAPTLNKPVDIYLIPSYDGGTTYVDASGSAPSPSHYVGSVGVSSTTSAQVKTLRGISLPPVIFKVLVINSADQALGAAGSTVKVNAGV